MVYSAVDPLYKVTLVVATPTWVGLTWILMFYCLPDYAQADGILAEMAG